MDMNKYQQLCVKEITGNINETEKTILDKWLAESSENRKEFEKIKSIWNITLPDESIQMPEIDMEWEALNNKIQLIRNNEKENISGRIYSFIQSLRLTSLKPSLTVGFTAILIITGIFLLKNEIFNNKVTAPRFEIVTTASKEQRSVQLPDGSVVVLNHSSKITFPEKFSDKAREVKLTGEAFFSVTKGKIPFVVTTLNAKTTVLGTKFNVWARDGQTEVFVKEGHVKLAQNSKNSKGVDLLKGQLSTIINNNLPTKPKIVNTNYLSGWMEGKLVFDQTPLNEVLVELERFYNVKLILKNEYLETQTITGSFKSHDIDSVLSMICLTMDLNYEKKNEEYIIK